MASAESTARLLRRLSTDTSGLLALLCATVTTQSLGIDTDSTSDTPLFRQIAEQIRERIASGELAPGDALPTVRGLARELGCNPSTVSRAYAELAHQGVIVGQRGAGTRVSKPPLPATETLRQARLVNLVERPLLEALSTGYTPTEVETAFALALSRWRELRAGMDTATAADASPQRLRFVGSHDPVVELLAARLRHLDPTIDLSVTFAGSLGGLIALARGEADVAGTHLRDEETGEYNVDFVRHILPGRPVMLVTLVTRVVGLLVASGNPKGIRGIEDLGRPGVTIVNRQAGSGTRVLLDARLRELGIRSREVAGYEREVTTHVAAASAVAQGQADAGIGVRSAAEALGLDFVPLVWERYDLVIPQETGKQPAVNSLLEIVRSAEFHASVEALGGYDTRDTGQVIRAG